MTFLRKGTLQWMMEQLFSARQIVELYGWPDHLTELVGWDWKGYPPPIAIFRSQSCELGAEESVRLKNAYYYKHQSR